MSQSAQEYKSLLDEVIKKQIVILGADITLLKIKKIKEISLDGTGTVTGITGQPQEITKQLIEQFKDLSEAIVKKTMKPLTLRDESIPSEEPRQPDKEQSKIEEAASLTQEPSKAERVHTV